MRRLCCLLRGGEGGNIWENYKQCTPKNLILPNYVICVLIIISIKEYCHCVCINYSTLWMWGWKCHKCVDKGRTKENIEVGNLKGRQNLIQSRQQQLFYVYLYQCQATLALFSLGNIFPQRPTTTLSIAG